MTRGKRSGVRLPALAAVTIGFFLLMTVRPGRADDPGRRAAGVAERQGSISDEAAWDLAAGRIRRRVASLAEWYGRTPPPERVTWGGLVACGGLGLVVLMERTLRLRERRVVPPAFTARFVDHLH